jgi:hypothetical protein
VRDDVQYYRDLYNLDRVEVLRGPNAMIFGGGGGGGVINRATKEAGFIPLREISIVGGSFNNKRISADFDQPLNDKVAFRMNGVYENSGSFRDDVDLERWGFMAPGEMRAGGVRSVETVCRAGVGSVCLVGRFQQRNSVGGVRSAGFYGWFTKCASEPISF